MAHHRPASRFAVTATKLPRSRCSATATPTTPHAWMNGCRWRAGCSWLQGELPAGTNRSRRAWRCLPSKPSTWLPARRPRKAYGNVRSLTRQAYLRPCNAHPNGQSGRDGAGQESKPPPTLEAYRCPLSLRTSAGGQVHHPTRLRCHRGSSRGSAH